jgi:hypothetical protein
MEPIVPRILELQRSWIVSLFVWQRKSRSERRWRMTEPLMAEVGDIPTPIESASQETKAEAVVIASSK